MVTYNIVRGSVPVYWTQPGIKYRPNPIVQRSEHSCFEKWRWCSGREGEEGCECTFVDEGASLCLG